MAKKYPFSPIGLLALLVCFPTTSSADNNSSLQDYPLEVCIPPSPAPNDGTQSGSAAAVTNSNIVQGDNTLFASYYNHSNMTGDLKAFSININTGEIITPAQWSAQSKLDGLSNNSATGNGRKLYTHIPNVATAREMDNGNGGSSFCNDSTRRDYLNTNSEDTCRTIIGLLKGDTTNSLSSSYRIPAHRLGTIVHSEPVYISNLQRVIQAANDGMVHAFKHDGAANNAGTNGEEAWAYIPKAFLYNIGQGDARKITEYNTIGYTHKFWLDATPAIETFATNENYFASGYGKGAKGVFSLTLGASSPTPKWEFNTTNDSNVGYLYGRPIITKVNDDGTLKIVAIFASGFNNTDLSNLSNSSYLYVVDLTTTTPTILRTIAVTGKGLNYIAGYSDSYSTLNQVKYVYGGDLEGNVWRFDLTSTTKANWSAHKLASLNAPITSEPELAAINVGGAAKRIVYVGTGRYLTLSDIPDNPPTADFPIQTGAMYGLIDRIDSVANYNDDSDATTISQLSIVNLNPDDIVTGTPGNISTHGWAVRLPAGQRVINSPALANGTVLFTANKPANACTVGANGMESWLYAIDYQTGLKSASYKLSDYSSGNDNNADDKNFLASRPTVIKLGSGQFKAMIRTTDGETIKVDVGSLLGSSSGAGTARGVSWREVITQ